MLLSHLRLAETLGQAGLDLVGPALQTPDLQTIARPEPVLEVLDGAETLELTIDHDPQPGAQSLALLHAVGGQHHGLPCPHHLQHGVPQEPPGPGVHPGGRLVQEHDGGVTHQSYRGRQFPLVAPGVSSSTTEVSQCFSLICTTIIVFQIVH